VWVKYGVTVSAFASGAIYKLLTLQNSAKTVYHIRSFSWQKLTVFQALQKCPFVSYLTSLAESTVHQFSYGALYSLLYWYELLRGESKMRVHWIWAELPHPLISPPIICINSPTVYVKVREPRLMSLSQALRSYVIKPLKSVKFLKICSESLHGDTDWHCHVQMM